MDIDYVNNDSVIHVYHDEEAKRVKALQEAEEAETQARLARVRAAADMMTGGKGGVYMSWGVLITISLFAMIA
jgi:hypothetical protein